MAKDCGSGSSSARTQRCDGKKHYHVHLIQPLITAYLAGESQCSIADRLGIHRYVTRQLLQIAGIQRRNANEANKLRRTRLSSEERLEATHSAHASLTARQDGRAIAFAESTLRAMLSARGITCTPQVKVGDYIIDLAAYPAAIDMQAEYENPMDSARCRDRIKRLAELTWASYYVWMRDKSVGFSDRCADDCARFVENLRRDPARMGNTRVPVRVVTPDGKVIYDGKINSKLLFTTPPS